MGNLKIKVILRVLLPVLRHISTDSGEPMFSHAPLWGVSIFPTFEGQIRATSPEPYRDLDTHTLLPWLPLAPSVKVVQFNTEDPPAGHPGHPNRRSLLHLASGLEPRPQKLPESEKSQDAQLKQSGYYWNLFLELRAPRLLSWSHVHPLRPARKQDASG